ncbi:sensor histidine kinase [Palleronia sediminis]|uniref:C4-dicarboxylate transport sensor protein DctB n=1 Tax=Palleronia sediminis TaxID=2547833 RepID=A0A4R6AHL1_9RHOB|nr:ATP-binding protein [Palleronia sediminis]TDL81126.1 sensor histidine kinase [Palleronia sediminis]
MSAPAAPGPVAFPQGRRLALLGAGLVAAALALAAALTVLPRIESGLQREARQADAVTLSLVVQTIDQLVRRFDPVPELVADRPHLRAALADPDSATQVAFANEQLRLTARAVGAGDIVLAAPSGRVIAAASYRAPEPAVGATLAHQPHFRAAARGAAAFFHSGGVGADSGSLWFSTPVLDGIEVVGVLAVRVDMGEIAAGWRDLNGEIAIADGYGVVFLSSRPDWVLRTLAPLRDEQRAKIAAARQFPLDRLRPLETTLSPLSDGVVRIGIGTGEARETYLVSSAPVALPGWHAIVLKPLAPLTAQARRTLLSGVAGALALVFFGVVLAQWILRRREIERSAHRARDRLEARVLERTAQLDATNRLLRREIAERRNAETRLKETQEHLVQAGKLAALGKMSAALSHEINQPLAAIKSYASNAATFLDRDRIADARENVLRISQMTDRVARISTHLRNFARRPGDALVPVRLCRVVEQALELMAPTLRARKVEVSVDAPDDPLWTMGGEVRLQQVLVNILNNAVAAMEDVEDPRIEIAMGAEDGAGDMLFIAVRDRGPGLDPLTADQMFEPFFTARADRRGLGLGLSISYNIVEDFGGTLAARTHPEGGAEFRVRLRRAPDPEGGRTA